jgi:formylglycine-generating enzyme required for sulfatase activity
MKLKWEDKITVNVIHRATSTETPNATNTSPIKTGTIYKETLDGLSFDMVYIEGGTFNMGSNNGEDDEKPVHSVMIDDFYIGKYEVTNKEYHMYDPGHDGKWNEDNRPVDTVSWEDCRKYCQWLSNKTGKNYRLPTEAEWEYACRAGTTAEYYWGNSMNGLYCWYNDNSDGETHPVGQTIPNAYGLYDMSGNVCEWCLDWYGENYYSQCTGISNPGGPSSGKCRVSRGGSWYGIDFDCRIAYRDEAWPGYRCGFLGFRLVRSP